MTTLKKMSDLDLRMRLSFYKKKIRALAGIDNKKSNEYFHKHEKVEDELVRRGIHTMKET